MGQTQPISDTTRLLQELQPGDPATIDRYTVLRRIPGSHVSDVFVVRDDRLLVLKLSGESELTDPERITREAEHLKRIQSSRVAKFVDSGLWQGRAYFVQEFIDGKTLADALRERAATPMDAYRVACGLAEALRDVHAAGMVHRDVKPSNIIVSDKRGVVLVDFGIAHTATDTRLTRSGIAVGTPRYMSPEQAAGGPVDAASDVYQWGLVVGEVLLGRHPVLEGEFEPADRFGRLVADALRTDPLQRPTLRQVLAELDRTEVLGDPEPTDVIPTGGPNLLEARSMREARSILEQRWQQALFTLADEPSAVAAGLVVAVLAGLVLGLLTGAVLEGLTGAA